MSAVSKSLRALACFLTLVIAVPAPAETFDADKLVQHVNVYEAIVTYPPPSWVTGTIDTTNALQLSERFKKQDGITFIYEEIPKGESFDSWRRLYAVSGVYLGAKSREIPLAEFVRLGIAPFAQSCGSDNLKFEPVDEQRDSMTLFIYCMAMPNARQSLGYSEGMGEVQLVRYFKYRNTFISVYHEWRGPAFRFDDRASWPVGVEELDLMTERMKSIQLSDMKPK